MRAGFRVGAGFRLGFKEFEHRARRTKKTAASLRRSKIAGDDQDHAVILRKLRLRIGRRVISQEVERHLKRSRDS